VLPEHLFDWRTAPQNRQRNITPLLDDVAVNGRYLPEQLLANVGKSFQGSIALGAGFLLDPDEAKALIVKDARNSAVLFPYLSGEDLNSHPQQKPSRWAIYFFDWSLEQAEQYPDCIAIVRERVYPERQKNNDRQRRDIWWRFTRPTVEHYATIATLKQVLFHGFTSKYLAFSFVPKGYIYAGPHNVFALDQFRYFATLQSALHEIWVLQYLSTMKTDIRYSSSDAFQTFPFPEIDMLPLLETIGETYHETRRQIMLARQEGLTDTYNRFHNPNEHSADIMQLRALHVEMDHAVAAACGWSDFDVQYAFHETPQGVRYTMPESVRREVLKRLLALNFERAAEEQAMLTGAVKVKKKGKKVAQAAASTPVAPEASPLDPNAPPPEQLDLFDDGSAKQRWLL